MILAALGIILIAKPIAALVIVALLGYSARTALTVALGLAQIGEFSFILSDLARKHGLMPDSGHNVLVGAAIISITLNPLLFGSLPAIEAWLRRHRLLWSLLNGRAERRTRHLNLETEAKVGEQHSAGERIAITMEDILERVFGRIEDEYPHAPPVSLRDAVLAGCMVLDIRGQTREEAIAEMAAAIHSQQIPPALEIARLASAREAEVSTDLGVGVAVPHARCANLRTSLVVFGRSSNGIVFSRQSAEPVRLLFLLVTPMEQPDVQLSLLAQIARIVADESRREQLRQASSESEVLDILDAEPLDATAPSDVCAAPELAYQSEIDNPSEQLRELR